MANDEYAASSGSEARKIQDRPSMQQVDHPEHNMPESEYDGTELGTEPQPQLPANMSLRQRSVSSSIARRKREMQ